VERVVVLHRVGQAVADRQNTGVRVAGPTLTDEQQALLEKVAVQIDNLPDGELGYESAGTITIDSDAAGYGWFVDPTPTNDSEFVLASADSPARNHVDLLSVVAHEMGHALGYLDESDSSGSVMSDSLALGVRHVLVPPGIARDAGASAPNGTPVPQGSSAGLTTDFAWAADLLTFPQISRPAGNLPRTGATDTEANSIGGPSADLLAETSPIGLDGRDGATFRHGTHTVLERASQTDVLDSLFAQDGELIFNGFDRSRPTVSIS
jgi:hypothetical protein